jgi:hypothetical protein
MAVRIPHVYASVVGKRPQTGNVTINRVYAEVLVKGTTKKSEKREVYNNDASATLNGSITQYDKEITVNDASEFPTDGNFRILVDDEIMLVTGISSNTLTVERPVDNTLATSHNDASSVYHIVASGSFSRRIKDEVVHAETKPLIHSITDENNNLLTVNDFSWLNQQNATATDTHNTIHLKAEETGGNNLQGLEIDTPNSAFTVIAGIRPLLYQSSFGSSNFPQLGVYTRDSSNGKLVGLSIIFRHGDLKAQAVKLNSPSSFNSDYNGLSKTGVAEDIWIKIVDDGTDYYWYYSVDGVVWQLHASASRTDFLTTPDKIVVGADPVGNSSSITGFHEMVLFHFSVET